MVASMLRWLAAVLLMQLLAQASGLVFAIGEPACEIAQDASPHGMPGEPEGCAPGCEDCLCCPHHRLLVLETRGTVALLSGRELTWRGVPSLRVDPPPSEIMHVPKDRRLSPTSRRA